MQEPQFYIPEKYMPSPGEVEAWRAGRPPALHQSGKVAAAHCWIFQTWLRLHERGFRCRLVHEVPSEGLLVTLVGCMPLDFRSPGGLFFAAIAADGYLHPGADIHLVQNPVQQRVVPGSVFIPLWPQPGIVPRDPGRGDRFENVRFYGDPENLAPELRAPGWAVKLKRELGVEFEICGADRWTDYREADAVIAARGFDGRLHLHKPATKLHNAWLAGVPFLCAAESAYLAERRGPDDCLVARDEAGLTACLRRLRDEPGVAQRLRANAATRALECAPEAVCRRWVWIFEKVLPPRFATWQRRGAAGRQLTRAWTRVTLPLRQRLAESRAGEALLRRRLPR